MTFIRAFQFFDTPGIQASQGVEADEKNISKIIAHSKSLKWINIILLVINAYSLNLQTLQDTLILFIKCFGIHTIKNLAILFTHCYDQKSIAKLRQYSNDIAKFLSEASKQSVKGIPFFCIENDPDSNFLLQCGLSEGLKSENLENKMKLLRLANNTEPFNTENAEARTFLYREEIKEINRRLEEEKLRNKVVTEDYDYKSEESYSHSKDVYEDHFECFKKKKRFLGIRIGSKTCVRPVRIYVRTDFYYRRNFYKRKIQVLGSGEKNYGPWEKYKTSPSYVKYSR